MRVNGAKYLRMPVALIKDLPEGYYALKREDEDFDFWRIGVQRDRQGEIASWRLQVVPRRTKKGDKVKLREVLLIAKTGESEWTSMTVSMASKINDALKRIMIEGDRAQIEYGKRTGHCGDCGTELTDEISLNLGIGPICRQRKPYLMEE